MSWNPLALPTDQVLLVALSVGLAALIRAFTGFGFAMLVVPAFSLFLSPGDAVVLSAVLALLLGLMVAYALLLRPAGFLLSTSGFLIVGAMILGERKLWILIPVAAFATGVVWYLVEGVLGIFLRPLPFFLG